MKKKLYLKRIYDKCKKNEQLLRSVTHNGVSLFYRQTIDLIVEITFKIKCVHHLLSPQPMAICHLSRVF